MVVKECGCEWIVFSIGNGAFFISDFFFHFFSWKLDVMWQWKFNKFIYFKTRFQLEIWRKESYQICDFIEKQKKRRTKNSNTTWCNFFRVRHIETEKWPKNAAKLSFAHSKFLIWKFSLFRVMLFLNVVVDDIGFHLATLPINTCLRFPSAIAIAFSLLLSHPPLWISNFVAYTKLMHRK